MCHSVEMYLPKVTRSAAEHRLGAADRAQAAREIRLIDGLISLVARIRAARPLARLRRRGAS